MAELERRSRAVERRFRLITQNVDRLQQQAGSSDVVELHGSLWDWRCTRCGAQREERAVPFADYPPRCPCGGPRRPGVVWFGEQLPAASLVRVAARAGARTVEINPRRTAQSDLVDMVLRGPSGTVLPRVLNALDTS